LIVQEKHGSDLEAAAERVEGAVGDVALGEARLRGFCAIDVDFVERVIKWLLHVGVGNSGDLAQFSENFVGHTAIPFRVRAFDLDVHGGWQAEVENLRGDIGGQKIESGTGILRGQLLAEFPQIRGSGVMIFVERDKNVGIAGADEPGSAVHVIDAAVRQADVVGDGVQLSFGNGAADGGFNLIAELGSFFDARSRFRAEVENELAAVRAGKEILSEPGDEQKNRKAGQQESRDKDAAMADETFEQGVVRISEIFERSFESTLKPDKRIAGRLAFAFMFLQEIHGKRGNQGAGEDVGGDHGEHDGLGQRNEKVTGDAAEKKHRHKDDADTKGGNEGGDGDLGGTVENGFTLGVTFLEVTLDIFDGDGGVVDQDTDGQSETSEGHDVDGLVKKAEDDDRGENRERNRNRDDEGAAPASQEDENHDAGEAGGNDRFTDHAADGGADKDGLVGERVNFELGRESLGNAWKQGANAFDDIESGGVTGFENTEKHTTIAVLAGDVGLGSKAVADVGNVAQIDGGVTDDFNGEVVEFRDGSEAGVYADVVLKFADFRGARGKNHVLLLDGEKHVLWRESLGLKEGGVEIDHDLALLSTVRERYDRAGNGDELRTEEILPQVVQFLLREPLAGKAELDNGHAGCAVIDDEGRKRARGQLAQDGLRNGSDLRVGIFQAGVGLKEYFDNGLAVYGGGFDVLDVVDCSGENALVYGGDAAFEFFRVETVVLPGNGDDGYVDVGENVRWCAQDDYGTHQEDEKSKNNERVRPIQSDTNDPHQDSPCSRHHAAYIPTNGPAAGLQLTSNGGKSGLIGGVASRL